MLKDFIALALAGALGVVPACGPVTLSATFGEDNRPPRETTVAGDRGASSKFVLIDIRGLIADSAGEGLSTLLLPTENPVDELAFRLDKAARDSSVKGIILRINSPGGTVTASDIMYRQVRRFVEETNKPVVASLGEVAASGGYYLALAATEIIAEPTSLAGSIGVVVPTINVSEGLGRIGVKTRNVTSGPNKAMGDPLTPPEERHYEILQTLVNDYYARFRNLVIERRSPRGLKQDLIDEITDGRIMSGARAVAVGLADREGGLEEALESGKKLAGVERARLVKYTTRGPLPRSPYSRGPSMPATRAEPGGTEINLLQVQLANGLHAGAGANAYYLWLP